MLMKNMIRFMTIAMMLLVSTGFTACSDDDDDDKASWPTTGNAVFDEPYLGFGASISKVKGVMSGQRLHKEGSTSGSPYLFIMVRRVWKAILISLINLPKSMTFQ